MANLLESDFSEYVSSITTLHVTSVNTVKSTNLAMKNTLYLDRRLCCLLYILWTFISKITRWYSTIKCTYWIFLFNVATSRWERKLSPELDSCSYHYSVITKHNLLFKRELALCEETYNSNFSFATWTNWHTDMYTTCLCTVKLWMCNFNWWWNLIPGLNMFLFPPGLNAKRLKFLRFH